MVFMMYFEVYHTTDEGLNQVATIQALDAGDALRRWAEKYGDNFGKVVILPPYSGRYHVAFNNPVTHI